MGLNALAGLGVPGALPGALGAVGAPPAEPSSCCLLKNMFDPNGEDETNDKDFFDDLKEDVKEECGKHGTVLDAKIDRRTAGFVYMRFADVEAAGRCVASLNGRWFAGKQISAEYIPEAKYETLDL